MSRQLLATVLFSFTLLSLQTPLGGSDLLSAPLHQAAAKDDRKTLKKLLTQGANINQQNAQGKTALLVALENQHFKTADWLITRGTDLSLKDADRRSVLYLAIRHGSKAIAFRLILGDFNPNDKAANGESVLELAAMQGWADVVGLLIDKGAKTSPPVDRIDLLPAYKAGKLGYNKVVKRLSKMQTAGPFILAFYASPKTMKISLRHTQQTIHSFLPKTKETLLHLACHGNNRRLAAYLIKAGSDINAADHNGQTPLHIATRHGYIRLIKLLLRSNAKTTLPDNHNQTPLDLAHKRQSKKLLNLLQQ
ncbi:ankyrin repeat domain-containing protein [bacterium]|nr:ankyrin repeat domain-containing protein [bacterium]